MINNKSVQSIIDTLAEEMNIPKEVVTIVYRSQWEFIRNTLKTYPKFNNIDTEEEFNNYRTNFNIPSIGKIFTTWDKVQQKKKQIIRKQNKNEIKD